MKKKFQPAVRILRSRAKPSRALTTLQFPDQGSLSSPRSWVIRGPSSIRIVPTLRVGVMSFPDKHGCTFKLGYAQQLRSATVKRLSDRRFQAAPCRQTSHTYSD